MNAGIKQEFYGISGDAVEAYFHLVKLQVVGSADEMEIAIGFTDSKGVGALLGQSDSFSITKSSLNDIRNRWTYGW